MTPPHRASGGRAAAQPARSGTPLAQLARVGVLSDTHGLLRPEAVAALAGSELLVHAGDIGAAGILPALRAIAPLVAIRGNNDTAEWAAGVPATATAQWGAVRLYVVHDRADLELDPRAAGIHVVISGHSHRPAIEHRDGVLYVNPGSCGPRRFSLPVTVARLTLHGTRVEAEIVDVMTGRPGQTTATFTQ